MNAAKQPRGTLPDVVAAAAADALRLLADDTRLKILWVLMQDEANVGTIASLVGSKPPAVSQHLAKLRSAGMVQVRREGTYAYYEACDDHISRIVVDLLDHTREELAARASTDRRRESARRRESRSSST